MSELTDRTGEALTGRPALSRYDDPFVAAISQLVTICGSVVAAAALIGVHPDSLRRYRRGARTPKDGGRAIIAALRTSAIKPGLQSQIRAGTMKMSIKGTIAVSGDSRDRIIHPGRYIPGRVMERAVTAWKKGDDRQADKILHNAIEKYYVPGVRIQSVERVDFLP